MDSVTTVPATMSVEQAGRMLGVSRRPAYRAVARGEIPSVKVGRRLLVPTQRLCDLLGVPVDDASVLAPPQPLSELEGARRGSMALSPSDGWEAPRAAGGDR